MPPSSKARRRRIRSGNTDDKSSARISSATDKNGLDSVAAAKLYPKRNNRSCSLLQGGDGVSTRTKKNGQNARRERTRKRGLEEFRDEQCKHPPVDPDKSPGTSASKSFEDPLADRPLRFPPESRGSDDSTTKRKRRRNNCTPVENGSGDIFPTESAPISKGKKRSEVSLSTSITAAVDVADRKETGNCKDGRKKPREGKKTTRIRIRLGKTQKTTRPYKDESPNNDDQDDIVDQDAIVSTFRESGRDLSAATENLKEKRSAQTGTKRKSGAGTFHSPPGRRKKEGAKKRSRTSSASSRGKSSVEFAARNKGEEDVKDYSSEEDSDGPLHKEEVRRRCAGAPQVGSKIAIKCRADPPLYPAGWYSATVLDIYWNKESSLSEGKSGSYTAKVEWDGGCVEDVLNPNWRILGDEPDRQGHTSHRDAKLRPFLKHWVKKLRCADRAETAHRAQCQPEDGHETMLSPLGQVKWIQCANPGCGKWRSLPRFLDSDSVLKSCSNTWYCVLNYWDDSAASCKAPQESGFVDQPATNVTGDAETKTELRKITCEGWETPT